MALLGTALTAVAVLVVVALHAVIASVAVRFFRLRLSTRWGPVLYTVFLVPLVYIVTTLLAFGVLGFGSGVSLDTTTLLVFVWAVPLALGVAIEVFWMPPPEAYDLPTDAQR